jgi:hypothetical protein
MRWHSFEVIRLEPAAFLPGEAVLGARGPLGPAEAVLAEAVGDDGASGALRAGDPQGCGGVGDGERDCPGDFAEDVGGLRGLRGGGGCVPALRGERTAKQGDCACGDGSRQGSCEDHLDEGEALRLQPFLVEGSGASQELPPGPAVITS